jgi:Asp/Glu/hydantoin racemase
LSAVASNAGDRARILVVNPNSTESVTRGIDAAVAPFRFADGPRIDCVTLAEGPPGIESQEQADSVVAPLCALVRREDAGTAAFVIACFGDPGLHAARAATGRPVFGIAQCAYLHALALGERFGVIAIVDASVPRHRRYVRQMGLEGHFGASVPIGVGVTGLAGEGVVERMVRVGEALRDGHGCDVVILGCAGMAGHRAAVERALGVPVVDPCQAAAARALAALRIDAAG